MSPSPGISAGYIVGCLALFSVSCGVLSPYPAGPFSPAIGEIRLYLSPEVKAFVDVTPQTPSSKLQKFLVSVTTTFGGREKRYNQVMLNLHGESSINFRRKSFSLHFPDNDYFFNNPRKVNEFLLVALVEDRGYFNDYLGYSFLRQAGLFYSHFEYVRGYINDTLSGLYLLVEKTQDALVQKAERPPAVVFRRDYGPRFEPVYVREGYEFRLDSLHSALDSLYVIIRTASRDSMLGELQKTLDVGNYCRWLGINKLVNNGDYLDELFFYSLSVAGKPSIFRVSGWDYEDLFLPPHGGVAIPGSLIYCGEDPLDVAIANDSAAYTLYGDNLRWVLGEILTPVFIDTIEGKIKAALVPVFRDTSMAKIMSNFSSSPRRASDELNTLITGRFSFIRAHRDSILNVLGKKD